MWFPSHWVLWTEKNWMNIWKYFYRSEWIKFYKCALENGVTPLVRLPRPGLTWFVLRDPHFKYISSQLYFAPSGSFGVSSEIVFFLSPIPFYSWFQDFQERKVDFEQGNSLNILLIALIVWFDFWATTIFFWFIPDCLIIFTKDNLFGHPNL